SVSDPSTPLQSGTFQSLVDAVAFEDLSVGNYFDRVTTACYSVDTNVTLSTSGTVPQAEVSNPVICPGSPTTVAIIAASQNLFDVTWSANGQVVGTGMPITLAPTVTTTYTATYTLKSIYGCANSPVYTSDVTVTVTPNPDLSLAVTDINLCDGTAPSVTISNTQSEFTYEIVSSNGTSFSPPLIANGNGGNLTIAIPNSITLTAGQVLKVKSTNGNAGCTGLLTDVCNVLNGTFNITCPTFPLSSVQCYGDLPSQTSYTISQFQALGNGDGIINVVGCGVIEITATNGPNPGCNADAIRTYTITEYADPNNNGVRDSGENTILHTTNCTQAININDTTAPTITGTLSVLNISGLQPLITNAIALSTTDQVVVNSLSTLDFLTVTGGEMYGPSIVSSPVVASVAKLNNNQWIFACWNGSGVLYTKMVLVEFSIISGQLQAKIVQSKYTTSNSVSSAANILAAWNASSTTTSPSPNAYGVRFITLSSLACDVLSSPVAMTTVSALEAAGLTISDNCTTDANLVVTSSDGTATGTCLITFTRTYTITDACNNATTATQTININDTTAPVVTGALTAASTNGCSITDAPAAMTSVSQLEAAGLTISDNCTTDANLVVTSSDGTATGTCPITFTRTYTITDACNRASTATQTININDITAPVVTTVLGSINVTLECSDATAIAAALAQAPVATDNCTIRPTLNLVSDVTTPNATCANSYQRVRTWNFTDGCGNTSSNFVQTITVQDTTAPVVTSAVGSLDVTLECSDAAAISAALASVPVATDNCASSLEIHLISDTTTISTLCANTYIRTRVWNFTDGCSNLSNDFTQIITIQDDTKPNFIGQLPQNLTLECNQIVPSAAVLTASDNCNGIVTIDFEEETIPGSCPSNSTILRTWIATDVCGNFETHSQTITIEDNTPPTFDQEIRSPELFAKCDAIPAPQEFIAVDLCGTATVSYNEVNIEGDCTNKYRIERTWRATDSCGNFREVKQTVYLACDIEVFNAVSPDGDGLNDTFKIEGLECYPNNTVEIYNRWGVKVYETSSYDNFDNSFKGFSDGRTTMSRSEKLPTGTY
ncbi:gliding motility-associated C-terminal domain-containing protein, partial [Flavobacterium sp.]|uniref:HYR-like domain-containing protein n=1 Tax=Flavobacterium sp. TaxID=239 RepID=UPI0037BF0A8E